MITLELKTLENYISRPIIKVIVSDNTSLENSLTIDALLDTGADISFIDSQILGKFNFFQKQDVYKNINQTVYAIYFSIENLVNNYRLFAGSKELLNYNPKEKKFDMLLGRDFLKHCKMEYIGKENKITLAWIN